MYSLEKEGNKLSFINDLHMSIKYLFTLFFILCAVLQYSTLNASNNESADCMRIVSASEDPTPAQITGGSLPVIVNEITWQRPATALYKLNFSGVTGSAASHEGVDYVHNDQAIAEVVIRAAADGKVVYVREGCEQTSMFSHNNTARESGAGWGNHIVISHKSIIFTRYGHLLKNSILVNVGDSVKAGQIIAIMGNSGRSETRHMHFELGTKTTEFNACAMSQNFDRIFNAETLNYQSTTSGFTTLKSSELKINVTPNPAINEFTLTSNQPIEDNATVSFIDIAGRKQNGLTETSRTENTRKYELTGSLSLGIYFLVLNENNNQQCVKIKLALK